MRTPSFVRAVGLAFAVLMFAGCPAGEAPPGRPGGTDARATGEITHSESAPRTLPIPGLEAGPWPTERFTPPPAAAPPPHALEGVLELGGGPAEDLTVHADLFELAHDPRWRIGELPPLRLELVADGPDLLPTVRGPQPADHPYWEFLAEPGRAWADPGQPERAIAVLPFALKEGNQNCVHYGLARFTYGADGIDGPVDWQIASETCLYLKFDAWGRSGAAFTAGVVPEAESTREAWRNEQAAHMPTRPVAALLERDPDLDLDALAPPAVDDATAWGVVLDGVHYRSDCPTRQGPHPFCDRVALPSYSTAKSLFAGLVFLRMVRRWPELESVEVPQLLPECALGDGRWDGVRLRHLVDMTTGNYDSAEFHADEDAAKMQAFFLATTSADKLRFACEAWPRQSEPGSRPVYHSSDDYLLGVALNRFLKSRLGETADIHRDILVAELLAPENPGPLLDYTQRTYDDTAQPFVSWGLYFHPDDVARLGQYLQDDAALAGLLNPADLEGVRFRDRSGMQSWALSRGEGYNAGFWGFDIAPHAGCEAPAWVPFMSGYGGIRWALPPGGAVYWFFTDGGHGSWMDALIALRDLSGLCGQNTTMGATP